MKLRPFISWIITWSFLVMTWTGIMLFIVPKGRVADWIKWEFMGLSKENYTALHVTFMVIFVLGAIVHIILNWKLLVNYLKNRERDSKTGPKIFIVTLIITLFVVWGTLANIPPFSTFLQWQEEIKIAWEDPKTNPPYGHAELATLESLASRMGWDLDKTKTAFKDAGFNLSNPKATINDLAKENNTTPQVLFDTLSKKMQAPKSSATSSTSTSKSGYGKLTLMQAAKQEGFDLEKAIGLLHVKGIDANADSALKPIAESLGVRPGELIEIFKE